MLGKPVPAIELDAAVRAAAATRPCASPTGRRAAARASTNAEGRPRVAPAWAVRRDAGPPAWVRPTQVDARRRDPLLVRHLWRLRAAVIGYAGVLRADGASASEVLERVMVLVQGGMAADGWTGPATALLIAHVARWCTTPDRGVAD